MAIQGHSSSHTTGLVERRWGTKEYYTSKWKYLELAFSTTLLSFDPSPGNPHEYPHKPYIATNWKSLGYMFAAEMKVCLHSNIRSGLRKCMYFETRVRNQCIITLVLSSCPISQILQVFYWKRHPTYIPP